MSEKEDKSVYDYTTRAESCDPDDFWGQVRRTINGKPVPQEQIDMIVNAVIENLHFKKEDILLDIGCGNGALTRYFYEKCSGSVGVDRSSFLIDVAKDNFEVKQEHEFVCADAIKFVNEVDNPERFTKAMCYGVFSFFSEKESIQFLTSMSKKFVNIEYFYIGNVRDLDRSDKFFINNKNSDIDVRDHTSTMGIWRTQNEMRDLVNKAGWDVEFRKMPSNFYAHEYYFDAILSLIK